MIHAFLDTSVLLHAFGGEHPQRNAARDLVARAAEDITIHVGAETVQEFLFHKLHSPDRGSAVPLTRWLLDLVVVHPFDVDVAREMLNLVESAGLGGRDAVLAATARMNGFAELITHDTRFVVPRGLTTLTARQFLDRTH